MTRTAFQIGCKLTIGYEIKEGRAYFVSLMTHYTIRHLFKKYIVLTNSMGKSYNIGYDEFFFNIVPKIYQISL